MSDRIQVKRDLAINWNTNNPTLHSGEIGYETNTGKMKIGNGSTDWVHLSYLGGTGDEVTSNKVTSISGASTDIQYPSAKLVYDQLALKVDKIIGKGLSTNDYTTAEQSKLSGIATGATVYTDAMADARVVTGTTGKVDKIIGKGLSTNDYTTAEQSKVSNLSGTNSGDETATRIAAINHGTAEKTAIVNADEVSGMNSANSFSLIRTTWTDVKAFLKTYFDGLYNLYSHPNHSGEVTSVGDGAQTIANSAVTLSKMANLTGISVIGKTATGAGAPEEINMTNLRTIAKVPEGSGLTKITVGTTQPSTPSTGDLWVDTN